MESRFKRNCKVGFLELYGLDFMLPGQTSSSSSSSTSTTDLVSLHASYAKSPPNLLLVVGEPSGPRAERNKGTYYTGLCEHTHTPS